MSIVKLRTPLDDLVSDVRSVMGLQLSAQTTAEAVASCIAPALRAPDLLDETQRQGSEEHYQQHILHVEPDGSFSVLALVWLPGQATTIHDHVCWCAVGVYEGQETEARYRLAGPGGRLARLQTLVNENGSVSGIAPPGDIHRVVNSGPGKAISIHVYGADIGRRGTSIRRSYPG